MSHDTVTTRGDSGEGKGDANAAKGSLEDFVVPRNGHPDLKFKGTLLGEAGNYKGDHSKPHRWEELNLYRTKGGSYVCHRRGDSSYPGELVRDEAKVISGPKEGKKIVTKDVTCPESGTPLSRVSVRAATMTEHEQIVEWFGRGSLAKLLFEEAGIEDIEEID